MNDKIIIDELRSLSKQIHALDHTPKEYLTVSEASYFLGISKSTIYKLTSAGELPFYKPHGKIILFKRSDLENWITANRIPSIHEIKKEVTNG